MNTETAAPKLDKNDPNVIIRAYKFALKPTKAQERKLRQHTGGARFAYNYFIPSGATTFTLAPKKKSAVFLMTN
jgi:hypothetical protein